MKSASVALAGLPLLVTLVVVAPAAPAVDAPAASSAAVTSASSDVAAGEATSGTLDAARGVSRPYLQVALLNHNWAGYVQRGRTSEVSARFVVPRLAKRPSGYASTWVGIDGYDTRYLTQVGVAEQVVGDKAAYYAWWEVLTPASMPPMQRFSIAVRPGDSMLARVTCGGGSARMAITNLTTHRSASRTVRYSGPCGSGEWIQEAVSVDHRISPSPNWGQVRFSSVTRNRANARLRSSQSLDIMDGRGSQETRTSAPRNGNSFTVTWLRAGSWTTVR